MQLNRSRNCSHVRHWQVWLKHEVQPSSSSYRRDSFFSSSSCKDTYNPSSSYVKWSWAFEPHKMHMRDDWKMTMLRSHQLCYLNVNTIQLLLRESRTYLQPLFFGSFVLKKVGKNNGHYILLGSWLRVMVGGTESSSQFYWSIYGGGFGESNQSNALKINVFYKSMMVRQTMRKIHIQVLVLIALLL